MSNFKDLAKEKFTQNINKKIKALSLINDDEYIINDSYRIKFNFHSPTNYSDEDIRIMYAIFEGDKFIENLCYVNKKEKYIITKYPHRKEHKEKPTNHELHLLCKYLRKIHNKEAFDFLPSFDIIKEIEELKKTTKDKLDGRIEGRIIRQYNRIIKNQDKTLCLNLRSPNDVMFGDDDLTFINVSTSGLSFPQLDIAFLIHNFHLKEEEIITFIKQYYGKKYTMLKLKRILTLLEIIKVYKYYLSSTNNDENYTIKKKSSL